MTNKYVILSDVAEVFNGKTPSKKEQRGNGYPVLKIKDVNGKGYFLGNFNSFVDIDFYNKNKAKRIKIGDTLILNAAHSSEYVGSKQYFADNSVVDSIATGEWLLVRPISEKIDRSFVHYWLRSAETFFKIKKLVRGIHLYPKDVKRLKIPLLPLAEQKRIAAILDKADAIRRKREKAIQLADEFLRSVFLDMFGNPAINPNKFPLTKLNTLYSKKKSGAKCGPFGSALKKYEYTETGVPVWTMDNIKENEFQENGCLYITNEKFDALKAYTVEKGDILISRAGTVGKMCVATPRVKDSIISTNLIRLSLDLSKIKPIYFTTLMNSFKSGVGRLKTGEDGAYTFMNTGILSELKIPLPPMPLQIKYYNFHQKIQSLKRKYITNENNNIFKSITQRAFRGDL